MGGNRPRPAAASPRREGGGRHAVPVRMCTESSCSTSRRRSGVRQVGAAPLGDVEQVAVARSTRASTSSVRKRTDSRVGALAQRVDLVPLQRRGHRGARRAPAASTARPSSSRCCSGSSRPAPCPGAAPSPSATPPAPGVSPVSCWASALAYRLGCSRSAHPIGAYTCMPLEPDVFTTGSSPSAASSSRSRCATSQHSTTPVPGPGVEVEHQQVGQLRARRRRPPATAARAPPARRGWPTTPGPGRRSSSTMSSVSRPREEPGVGTTTARTHSGRAGRCSSRRTPARRRRPASG